MGDTVFTPELTHELNAPLDPSRVTTGQAGPLRGIPYLEGHDVARRANELFGYGNWSFELLGQPWAERGNDKSGNPYTIWCALGRVSVRGGLTFSDVGTNQQSGPGGPATEMSIKGAVTDAMKRCLRLYGDQFGLVLYDKSVGRGDLEAEYQEAHRASPAPATAPAPAGQPSEPPPPTREDLEWEKVYAIIGESHERRADVQRFLVGLYGESVTSAKTGFYRWIGEHPGRDAAQLLAAAKGQAAGASR